MNWNKFSSPLLNELNYAPGYSLIYKHSNRCGTCHRIQQRLESQWEEFSDKELITPFFINVIEEREISNEIADRYNIPHQSPQIIFIKNGKVLHDASHGGVDLNSIENLITKGNEQPSSNS